MIFLSVVIPSYNEMANLRKGVLDRVKRFLDSKKYEYEVIVVDDGSKDGSIEFVKKFEKENKEFRLIENKHMGKAGAVTTGMLQAKGEYIVFADMDQATPIEEIDNLLPYLKDKNYAVAIGSRTIGELGYPWSRKVQHEAGIMMRKMIVGLPQILDTQCGFKMFRRVAAQEIFAQLYKVHNGFKEISHSAVQFGFDVELLIIAVNRGYKIKEVPVQWLYVESRRVSPMRDSVDGILNLFRIKLKQLQGKYQ